MRPVGILFLRALLLQRRRVAEQLQLRRLRLVAGGARWRQAELAAERMKTKSEEQLSVNTRDVPV